MDITAPAPAATPAKILVVEDEPPMRKMLSGVLQQAGYTVVEASNGKEGLQLANSERPQLVITDNFMPVMNGVDMIVALRKETWAVKLPVILMTNVNSLEAVNQTLQAGGVDYLMKADVQLAQVVSLVQQRLKPAL